MSNIIEFKYSSKNCRHGTYFLIKGQYYLECKKCNEKIDPHFVLEEISKAESFLRHRLLELRSLIEKSKEKVHCKCQYCGKMTRIHK